MMWSYHNKIFNQRYYALWYFNTDFQNVHLFPEQPFVYKYYIRGKIWRKQTGKRKDSNSVNDIITSAPSGLSNKARKQHGTCNSCLEAFTAE